MNPILLPVKPFQQNVNAGTCGPASLKMVFEYYGLEKSEIELAQICGTTYEMGISAEGLKKGAEAFGFTVEIKDYASFEDLEMWLNKKVPVIVDWFTRGRMDYDHTEVPDGHYSVVVGLDNDFIYLQDPEIGELRTLTREDFMKVWFDFTGKYIAPNELVIRQIIAVYR